MEGGSTIYIRYDKYYINNILENTYILYVECIFVVTALADR